MDMWFMRTIGRLTGNLKDFDPELYKEQLNKFRNALNVNAITKVLVTERLPLWRIQIQRETAIGAKYQRSIGA
jgi:hypothetical protein